MHTSQSPCFVVKSAFSLGSTANKNCFCSIQKEFELNKPMDKPMVGSPSCVRGSSVNLRKACWQVDPPILVPGQDWAQASHGRVLEGGEPKKPSLAQRRACVNGARTELQLLGAGKPVTQLRHQATHLLLFLLLLGSETIREGATDQPGKQMKACSFRQVNFKHSPVTDAGTIAKIP